MQRDAAEGLLGYGIYAGFHGSLRAVLEICVGLYESSWIRHREDGVGWGCWLDLSVCLSRDLGLKDASYRVGRGNS